MAKIRGQHTAVLYQGYDLSGRSNQADLNIEYGEQDVTCFGDGAVNSQGGLPRGEGVGTSFLDPATGSSHEALSSPGTHSGGILMAILGQNTAPAIGDPAFCMQANQFSYNPSVQVTDAIKAQWAVRSEGKRPDWGVCLAYTTITNTTTFSTYDAGAAVSDGGVAYLQIFDLVSTDSYAIKIQHSTDGTTWVDLDTFTMNGQTRGAERREISGTINRYRRVVATRTGAAGETLGLAVALAEN